MCRDGNLGAGVNIKYFTTCLQLGGDWLHTQLNITWDLRRREEEEEEEEEEEGEMKGGRYQIYLMSYFNVTTPTLLGLLILKRALDVCPTMTLLNRNRLSSSPYTPTQPS